MQALIPVLFSFLMAYFYYKQAKSRGEWVWSRFFILVGAIVVFFFGFMLPLIMSKAMDSRPGLMFSLLFGGILVFVGGIVYLFRKYPVKAAG
jgi:predicted membrane channel-forming protein YqfA (hemolysin III family)